MRGTRDAEAETRPAGFAVAALACAWLAAFGGALEAQVTEPSRGAEEAPDLLPADVSGPVYTWRDGDRTLRVWRQRDLSVRERGNVRPREKVVAKADDGLVVIRLDAQGQMSDLPVFRTQSGTLMTLPGGIMLIFDSSWGESEREAFFTSKGIAPERVSPAENLPFLFAVATEPGFPALELANALADEPGVEVSSPNWWVQRSPQ